VTGRVSSESLAGYHRNIEWWVTAREAGVSRSKEKPIMNKIKISGTDY